MTRSMNVRTGSRLAVSSAVCLLVALVGPTGGSLRAAPSAPGPNCTTGPTASQQACTLAMSHESPPPPPPPPHTDCTIQVMMDQVSVDQGQGISEGKLEVSVSVDAG